MRAGLVLALIGCGPASPTVRPIANTSALDVCASVGDQLLVERGAPVVCHAADPECTRVDLDARASSTVPRPARRPLAVPEVRDREVCFRGRCVPLGEQAAAAVAEVRSQGRPRIIGATADLAAVVAGHTAWSIAKDVQLELPAPPFFAGRKPFARIEGSFGAVLLVDFGDCAGPCHQGWVTTSRGVPVSKPLDGYLAMKRGDTVFAAISDSEGLDDHDVGSAVTVFDGAGRLRGSFPIETRWAVEAMVELDVSTVVFLIRAPDRTFLRRLRLGGPVSDLTLPDCPTR